MSQLTNGESLYALAKSVRIFPFKLDPGIIGKFVKESFITGESIAPIAANSVLPPISVTLTLL